MSAFVELFGAELVNQKEKVKTEDSFKEVDAVLVYFSAHWCPPCKTFTPILIKAFKDLQENGKKVQAVFVTKDRSEKEFDEYYGTMPWLAVPFSDKDRQGKLAKKYKVAGIPTLVILDKEGQVNSLAGRKLIMEDPKCEKFPWKPPTLKEALGDAFVNGAGDSFTSEALKGKTVGIYFSAHWCPPCKRFTPMLAELYKKLKEEGKDFEIVFVSGDKNEEAFKGYVKESMPWLALPFADRARESQLSDMFHVEGIPSFAVVDYDSGEVINPEARSDVATDQQGKHFPWRPKKVNDINVKAEGLNEGPGLIVFMPQDADEKAQEQVEQALLGAAAEAEAEDVLLLWARGDAGVVPQVKHFMEMSDHGKKQDTVMAIFDAARGASFHAEIKSLAGVTAEAVKSFLALYAAGKAPATPFHVHGGHGGHGHSHGGKPCGGHGGH